MCCVRRSQRKITLTSRDDALVPGASFRHLKKHFPAQLTAASSGAATVSSNELLRNATSPHTEMTAYAESSLVFKSS